jgi:hypothetical protein
MASMGWGTFLLFGMFDVLVALFTIFFLKETKGKSLEEIQRLYSSDSSSNKLDAEAYNGERSSSGSDRKESITEQ